MQPWIQIGQRGVPTYGLLILVGIAVGVALVTWRPIRPDLTSVDITNSAVLACIGVFVGAKLFYLLFTFLPLVLSGAVPLTAETFWLHFQGGFVFYGGVFGGGLAVWMYCRQYELSFWGYAENLVVALPLVQVFGRIGCFAAGCCYGRPTSSGLGVVFPSGGAAPSGVALWPVQLMEGAAVALLFLLLFAYSRRRRRKGQIAGLYLTGYSLIRFALEFFRGDSLRGVWAGLSTSRWISLVLFPLGIHLLKGRVSAEEKT